MTGIDSRMASHRTHLLRHAARAPSLRRAAWSLKEAEAAGGGGGGGDLVGPPPAAPPAGGGGLVAEGGGSGGSGGVGGHLVRPSSRCAAGGEGRLSPLGQLYPPRGEIGLDGAAHALGDLRPAFGRLDVGGVGGVGEVTGL